MVKVGIPLEKLTKYQCCTCIKKESDEDGLYHCIARNEFYFILLDNACWSFMDDPDLWLKTLLDIRAYNLSHSGYTFGTNVRQLNGEIQMARTAVEKQFQKDLKQLWKEESRRGKKGGGGVDPVGKAAEGCRLNDNRYKMVWGAES